MTSVLASDTPHVAAFRTASQVGEDIIFEVLLDPTPVTHMEVSSKSAAMITQTVEDGVISGVPSAVEEPDPDASIRITGDVDTALENVPVADIDVSAPKSIPQHLDEAHSETVAGILLNGASQTLIV